MSKSFMEKLLDGAPVEWKTLEEIFDLRNGYTPSKSNSEYWEDGTIPWFRMEDIRENGQILNDALQKVATNALKGGKLFPANSIIVATSATIGEHALITVPYLSNQRFTNLILKSEHSDRFEIKFLFYYCFLLDDWCKNNTTVSSFASVDMNGFRKLPIPIPPLPVQVEIVRILDAFTELTAELTARKKQYNYYRDQLLSFEEGEVEWKTLGETLVRTKGTNITAGQMKELDKFGAPLKVFAGGRTVAFVNFEDIPAKDVNREPSIIVKSRGVIEFEYYDKPFSHKNEMWSYHSKNDAVDIKFVYYFLRMNEPYFQNLGSKMQMPQIATPDTDKFQIPIPSLAEQERIVAILDKFDALTSSISEGLPREIRLRQKQYEYYRELLLSFPKPDGTK
ncbi:type I restriction modification DNA specificity domain protein [Leptospira kirschneri serovar Bim str. 1051]|nr:type I restriction modification DNA specificity domain protein [Leptospira kirschneri serovar Bim str. PUO 1247]EMN06865.1 type I restriction modification DNA specificity domain protein [Leptospira kirschneri serovar Bim str. 1051]